MKRYIIFLFMLMFVFTSCSGDKNKGTEIAENQEVKAITLLNGEQINYENVASQQEDEEYDTYTDGNGLIYYYEKNTEILRMCFPENKGNLSSKVNEDVVIGKAITELKKVYSIPHDIITKCEKDNASYYEVSFIQKYEDYENTLSTLMFDEFGNFAGGSFHFDSYSNNPKEDLTVSKDEALSIASDYLREQLGADAKIYLSESVGSYYFVYSNSYNGNNYWCVLFGYQPEIGPVSGYFVDVDMKTGKCVELRQSK